MVGPRVALLAKESVAACQRSSAGWMPESISRLSIGVGRRHPVHKASYRTPSITRVLALRHQIGAQCSVAK